MLSPNGTKSNSTQLVVYKSGGDKHANVNGLVLGPGFIRNKGKYAWAVHSAIRVMVSANSIPTALVEGFQTSFDYAPLHSVAFKDMKINAAGMALASIGVTYSKLMMDRNTHWLAGGITLNGLVGFDGMYIHAKAGEYSIPDSSSLVMNHMDLDYGHAVDEALRVLLACCDVA